MYSINETSNLTGLTARALRHYEEKGLINPSFRSANGYRHYSENSLVKIKEIKKLREMKFSIDEIKSFLILREEGLSDIVKTRLQNKIQSIDFDILNLIESKKKIEDQLLATNQFLEGKDLQNVQRRILMETIKSEILENLKLKRRISQKDLDYLKREDYLFDTPEKRDFIDALKDCLRFANKEGIKVGPARGASPALLSLYALGWNHFDPSEYNLVPERFSATDFELHIDVEFENGKKFIDYCKSISSKLKFGRIEAFKLPILDIIDRVHAKLPSPINYNEISNNDPIVLDLFRKGDIEKVFSFDFPKDTLMAKFMDDNYYRNGKATEMLSQYLRSQPIKNFQDLLNIEAIFRPNNLDHKPFMREYIDRYPRAKKETFSYNCLTSALNEYLKPNFGVIIYQEDIIHIIREYTSWDYEKCNRIRKSLQFDDITNDEKNELLKFTGKEVLNLIERESPVAFCKAHSVGAWSNLIKVTAILKTLHKDIYYGEIKQWEQENQYSWGDFGFISQGVSLLQQ